MARGKPSDPKRRLRRWRRAMAVRKQARKQSGKLPDVVYIADRDGQLVRHIRTTVDAFMRIED